MGCVRTQVCHRSMWRHGGSHARPGGPCPNVEALICSLDPKVCRRHSLVGGFKSIPTTANSTRCTTSRLWPSSIQGLHAAMPGEKEVMRLILFIPSPLSWSRSTSSNCVKPLGLQVKSSKTARMLKRTQCGECRRGHPNHQPAREETMSEDSACNL